MNFLSRLFDFAVGVFVGITCTSKFYTHKTVYADQGREPPRDSLQPQAKCEQCSATPSTHWTPRADWGHGLKKGLFGISAPKAV